MKTNSVYPSQSILLLRKVNSNTFSSVIIIGSTKQICFFNLKLFNYSINYVNSFGGWVSSQILSYHTQTLSDQTPILFHSVLQYKTEFNKLSSFQNYPAGAGICSALLKDFPTPRCCHLQRRDTTDFVRSPLENSGPEQAQGYVIYCRLSREPIHREQSRAQGSCYFFVFWLQSKYCKAHSKTRLSTECYFRTATCYTARSFPFCPFLLKWRVKKKKKKKTWIKKDIFMASGALEMQT